MSPIQHDWSQLVTVNTVSMPRLHPTCIRVCVCFVCVCHCDMQAPITGAVFLTFFDIAVMCGIVRHMRPIAYTHAYAYILTFACVLFHMHIYAHICAYARYSLCAKLLTCTFIFPIAKSLQNRFLSMHVCWFVSQLFLHVRGKGGSVFQWSVCLLHQPTHPK